MSRADELELYVGGVIDSTGKYATCSEFADRDQAQAIIRELESERDQLKSERDDARRELCAAEYANVFVDVRGPLRTLLRQTAETRWPGTGAELFPEEES